MPLVVLMGSSDTLDWLKNVGPVGDKSKSKSSQVSLNYDDEVEVMEEELKFKKPQANAIKTVKYSSKDLTGLKVAHDIDSFTPGQSDILVLDDVSVLDNSSSSAAFHGDSLVSLNVKEAERLKRLREVARHAKGYSGYKEYEDQSEDSIITLGRTKSGPSKILQKYDFATAAFGDEPALKPEEGFRIGSNIPVSEADFKSDAPVNLADFDTVRSSGQETISFRKKTSVDSEKELKRAKKLAKTFFADEPEMQIETEATMEEASNFANEEGEEDDFEIQRMISAARRENLQAYPLDAKDESLEAEQIFKGGKSFDSLMLVESIFASNETNHVEPDQLQMQIDDVNPQKNEDRKDDEMQTLINEEEVAFSAEPLVRNGVAATLALLNSRGINLKPRNSNPNEIDSKQKSDIKLEYFDQFGNKLSTKEAYKELSRKFHGKGPGKGRLDKMKRKREETLRLESSTTSALNQSVIVSNLRSHQEETGKPYMIVSNQRSSELEKPTSSSLETSIAASEMKKPRIFGMKM